MFADHGVQATIVPNVIDTTRFRLRERRDYGGSPHLVVTRNLEAIYGVDIAIRAFSRILQEFPGARLTIAGEGIERESLQRLVETLKLSKCVRFTGQLRNSDIAALYYDADLMLNASRVDNMPISILEGLACGLPVVSTAAGGIPDLVTDKTNALLAPVDDVEALSESILVF